MTWHNENSTMKQNIERAEWGEGGTKENTLVVVLLCWLAMVGLIGVMFLLGFTQ